MIELVAFTNRLLRDHVKAPLPIHYNVSSSNTVKQISKPSVNFQLLSEILLYKIPVSNFGTKPEISGGGGGERWNKLIMSNLVLNWYLFHQP